MASLSVQTILQIDVRQRKSMNFPWRPDIMRMQPDIEYAVDAAGSGLVSEAMLGALIERETGFRNIFQLGVPPGPGCGVGPAQITADVNWSDPKRPTYAGLDLTNVRDNLVVCCRYFLVPALRAFPGSHQAAFDAYNEGSGPVASEIASGTSPDATTTGSNYGRSVMETWIQYASIIQGVQPDWSSWTPL